MIERLFLTAIREVWDRLVVLRLRFEIACLKATNYDQLADTVQALRRALQTQERVQDDLRRQLEARNAQIEKLRDEYAALEIRRSKEGATTTRSAHLAVFKQLQPILTQLPALRLAIEEGAEVTIRDVLELLSPLDEMMGDMGFEAVGEAGAHVRYDPRLHRAVGRGARSVTPDDLVRVRYIGYLYDGEVVCKAEVNRVEQHEAVA